MEKCHVGNFVRSDTYGNLLAVNFITKKNETVIKFFLLLAIS